MEKREMKRLILKAGLEKQEKLIDDFKTRINEMKDSARMLNESQYDSQQASQNGENMERIDVLTGQLNFAQEELDLLHRLNVDAPDHDSVHMGSVIETDQRTFFISVSLEEFEANGNKVFGISTKAPIYAAMRGKLKGDSFEFNNIKYQIQDIY